MDAVTAVTWNVAGLDETDLDVRSEAQCFAVLLGEPRPDVVMLQEVVHRSWHAHWKHHLHHAGYRVFPADPSTDSEYFSLLAIRSEIAVTTHGARLFPGTQMGRRLVWAVAAGFWVATGHLESGRASQGERVRQIDEIIVELCRHPGPALFAGDTNLRVDEEPLVSGLDRVQDAWKVAGSPPGLRFTWQTQGRDTNRVRARFDRLYANERTTIDRLSEVDGSWPLSDHRGLRVQISRAS